MSVIKLKIKQNDYSSCFGKETLGEFVKTLDDFTTIDLYAENLQNIGVFYAVMLKRKNEYSNHFVKSVTYVLEDQKFQIVLGKKNINQMKKSA